MPTMDEMIERCIRECQDCQARCLETLTYCQRKGGDHARPGRLRTLQDCAEICQTTASFLQRGSDLAARLCSACSFVCKMAAADCDELGNDPVMLACAEICHRAFVACRELAASQAHAQAPGTQPVYSA